MSPKKSPVKYLCEYSHEKKYGHLLCLLVPSKIISDNLFKLFDCLCDYFCQFTGCTFLLPSSRRAQPRGGWEARMRDKVDMVSC